MEKLYVAQRTFPTDQDTLLIDNAIDDGARNSVGKLLQKYRPTLFNDSLLNGPTHTTSDLAMAS